MSTIKRALYDSIPAYTSQFPIGIVYGMLFMKLGYPWYIAPITSLLTLAGAIQFVVLDALLHGSPIIPVLVSIFFVGFRNSFYGLSLLDRFDVRPLKKWYWVFGLVDMTFSVLVSKKAEQDDDKYISWLTASIHFSWVLGTFVGAYFANTVKVLPGLEFTLTALFATFFIDQLKKTKDYLLALAALTGFFAAQLFCPNYAFLVGIFSGIMVLVSRREKWAY